MENAEKQGNGYWLPSGVVNTVVAGLVLMSVGSSGSALWLGVQLFAALDKIEALPSPELQTERRSNYLEFRDDSRDRLRRLERAVFWKEGQSQLFFKELEIPNPRPNPRAPYRVLDFTTNKNRFFGDFG